MRISLFVSLAYAALLAVSILEEFKYPIGDNECAIRQPPHNNHWVLCPVICDRVVFVNENFEPYTSDVEIFILPFELMSYGLGETDTDIRWIEHRAQFNCAKITEGVNEGKHMVIAIDYKAHGKEYFDNLIEKGKAVVEYSRSKLSEAIRKTVGAKIANNFWRTNDKVKIHLLSERKKGIEEQLADIDNKILEISQKDKGLSQTELIKADLQEFFKEELEFWDK
jgi:hypothetical protein